MAGKLAPAVGGDFALARIQPHDDVATKCGAGILEEAGVLHGCGANDDVAQACIQVALNRVQIANTTAQLHVHFAAHTFEYFADRRFVFGVPGKRAVQIDQMQPTRAFVNPGSRHQRRVFSKGGCLGHIALLEANT